jgi:serine/threonine-protein kinase
VAADSSNSDDTASVSSPNVRRVGSYVLQSELGRGGMGSVWRAQRDDGQYQAQVAIKLLMPAWAGEEGEVRFRQEGKLLARLDHPNIARLLDAGVTEQGEPYLVIEYVEGERIDDYCRRVGLSIRARIELFIEVVSAVAHAHRNLVVHRDIKPANVLVTAEGKAKLLDFGIGKLVEGEAALTRSGHTVLTPEYAAPEQLLGEPVTIATDIYTLGLLLYVLLTERLPYGAAQASPAELIRRITTGAMPLPSSIAMTQLQSGVAHQRLQRELRGDLDNIVLKAMRAAPEERYEDANALAADLRRFLNHEPVNARASTTWYRLAKFVCRNRSTVQATAAVLVVVTVGSVIAITQTLEAHRQRAAAQQQERTVDLFDDIINLALFGEGGSERPNPSLAERIQRGAAMIQQQYSKDPSFAGRMLMQLAEYLGMPGSTSAPTELIERALALGREANDTGLMVAASCKRARHLANAGMTTQASQYLQEAQRLLGTIQPDVSMRVEYQAAQALLERARGNREAAATLLLDSSKQLENAGEASQRSYPIVLSLLASVYIEQGKFAPALEVTERAAQMERELGYADTSPHLSTMQTLAGLRLSVGEMSNSLTDRERVSVMARKFYAADELPFELVYDHAELLLRLERAPEALAMLEAEMERARRADSPAVLLQMLQLTAAAHLRLQQWDVAESVLREAQPLVEQRAGATHVNIQMEVRHAELALGRNDAGGARKHIEAALTLAGYGTPEPQRALARTLVSTATIALADGRLADAQKYASDALRISESVARRLDSSADVGESLLLLAKAQAGSGPDTKQRARLERAVRCLSNGLRPDHPLTREARAMLANVS